MGHVVAPVGMVVSKVKRVVTVGGQFYGIKFKCPGCGEHHILPTQDTPPDVTKADRWNFNGDYERPVLSPSVLSRTGHYAKHFKKGDSCWCAYNAEQEAKGEKPAPFKCGICHSFFGGNGAQPGQIVFLGDCTHSLAGKTVELEEIGE